MKRSILLLPIFLMLSVVSSSYSLVDKDVDAKLNDLQALIVTIIEQSNIDPETAQELLDATNDLNQYIQNNIQQDAQDIRVAAALASIVETMDTMAQNSNQTNLHNILKNFKYATRANVIEKLVTSMHPEKLSDEAYYTDPYLESIGFIFNDWALNALFGAVLTTIAPTALGSALQLNPNSGHQKLMTKIAAGIAAHFAWLLEKKAAFMNMASQS